MQPTTTPASPAAAASATPSLVSAVPGSNDNEHVTGPAWGPVMPAGHIDFQVIDGEQAADRLGKLRALPTRSIKSAIASRSTAGTAVPIQP